VSWVYGFVRNRRNASPRSNGGLSSCFFSLRCRDFSRFVNAAEQARIVQTVGFKSAEVAAIVEIGVEHGAVMFTAGNEGDRLAAKEKVVRILRLQADDIGLEGLQQANNKTKRVTILILQALLANN
jgi:pimeloyl-CoA synthetase